MIYITRKKNLFKMQPPTGRDSGFKCILPIQNECVINEFSYQGDSAYCGGGEITRYKNESVKARGESWQELLLLLRPREEILH